jgi:ribosomal protein S18 acetylase RimI-like enzyme
MTLVIREATEADLPAVLRLYGQPGVDDGQVLPLAEAIAVFRRFRDYPDYRLFVADREGVTVGCYSLLAMENIAHRGARSAVIEAVAVDPACQGEGIGKAMMRHALDEARSRDCYKAALSSNLKRDAAHAFYDSLGFERHGYSFRVILQEVA